MAREHPPNEWRCRGSPEMETPGAYLVRAGSDKACSNLSTRRLRGTYAEQHGVVRAKGLGLETQLRRCGRTE